MLKIIIKITFVVLVALWIFGFARFVATSVLRTPEHRTKSHITHLEKAHAIIVLTGGKNRIKTGLNLFNNAASNNIFITGVHPSVTKNDILAMWNGNEKLPECCLEIGHIATTTIGNASETKAWIENKNIKTIYLVTSSYHINRAELEFRHYMPELDMILYPVKENLSSLKNLRFWKNNFTEYHKYMFRYSIIKLREITQ